MAIGNLNESKETTPVHYHSIKGSTVEDYFPQELKSPPFRLHFIEFLKTVSYKVNLAAQSSNSEVIY